MREGPLTLTARCRLNFPQFPDFPDFKIDEASVLVSTSEDHAAFAASSSGESFNGIRGETLGNRDLLTTTPEQNRVLVRVQTRLDISQRAVYWSTHFSAAAPDGTHLNGVLDAAVDALGSSGCVFGGHVVVG